MAGGFVLPLCREVVAARWLLAVLVGAVLWSAAGALEFSAATMAGKIFWSQVSYLGIVCGPVALFHFAYAHTHDQNAPPRALSVLTAAIGATILLSAATNSLHHLLWPEIVAVERDGLLFARYERGPFFWATVAYCYGFMFASSVMLAAHTLSLGNVFRQQSLVIILATLAPWITSLAYVLRVGPRPELDHTPVGFAVTGLLLSWAIARFRLLELIPVAANTLFLRLPDPVLVIDPVGRLVRANEAALRRFGPLAAREGRPLDECLSVQADLLEAIRSATTTRRPIALGVDWWMIESAALDDSGGRTRGKLVILRDITDAKRAELELLEAKLEIENTLARADALAREAVAANAAKSTFLTQVSHDLRTPLHAILGMTESLQGGPLEQHQLEAVTTISGAGDVLLRLINDLLDLGRIEAGRLDLAHEPFLLDDILDQVADILGPTARAQGLSFVHWIEPSTPAGWHGDPERVRQILLNLVGNAIKFTEQGGVTLRASYVDDALQFEVSDTGPGIAPEHLAGLFAPFNRGDPETARRIEGTGLGLAISRRLVEAMNGSIDVRSQLGEGSVFSLNLALRQDPAIAISLSRLAQSINGLRIAVAVPDPATREAVIRGLLSLGANPFAALPPPEPDASTALVIAPGDGSSEMVARWKTARRPVTVIATGTNASTEQIPPRRRQIATALTLTPTAVKKTFVAPPGPRHHVLLADDNALGLRVSSAQLTRCNCEVVAVPGGLPALERLAVEDFDVIVLDGQMPDLNGWEVASRIRSWPADARNANTPIIALTADLTPDAHARWLSAGVTVVFGKPVNARELHQTLQKYPTSVPPLTSP